MAAPTVPAWLGAWAPGLVQSHVLAAAPDWYSRARERGRERGRERARHRLTIYAYSHDDIKLRLGTWGGRERPVYPIDREPWHLTLPLPLPAPQHPSQRIYTEHRKVGWWEGEAAGWARGAAGGAALLALLVLLARAAERCRANNIFKRRRRSREWPTPSVRATSQADSVDGVLVIPGLENARPLPAPPGLPSSAPRAGAPPSYCLCPRPAHSPYCICDATAASAQLYKTQDEAESGDPLLAPPPPRSHAPRAGAPPSYCPRPAHSPYCICDATTASAQLFKTQIDTADEEPPPPYSDCIVQFNKGSSVLIYTRGQNDIGSTHNIVGQEHDNVDQQLNNVGQQHDNVVLQVQYGNIVQDAQQNNMDEVQHDIVQVQGDNIVQEIQTNNIGQEVQQNNDNATTEAVLRVNLNDYIFIAEAAGYNISTEPTHSDGTGKVTV